MAITYITSDIGIGTSTAGVDTTGADTIVIEVGSGGGAVTGTPTDSKSNTYTPLTGHSGSGGGKLFYAKNAAVGSAHTVSHNEGAFASIAMIAFAGCHLTAPFDTEAGTSGVTPGSITPSENGCVVVTGIHNDGSGDMTAASGFTVSQHAVKSGNRDGVGIAYVIQTTAGAANPTWTVGSTSACSSGIASFKSASVTVAPFFNSRIVTKQAVNRASRY